MNQRITQIRTLALSSLLAVLAAGCNSSGAQKIAATATSTNAAPESASAWLTDYPQALKVAAEKKKPVLLDFTGSDWCPPCKQLKRTVFDTDEFARYAREHLVLVEVDFPRSKPQSSELAAQNQRLQKQYSIEGYPTLILLSPEGKEIKRSVGFSGGGPKAFIQWAGL